MPALILRSSAFASFRSPTSKEVVKPLANVRARPKRPGAHRMICALISRSINVVFHALQDARREPSAQRVGNSNETLVRCTGWSARDGTRRIWPRYAWASKGERPWLEEQSQSTAPSERTTRRMARTKAVASTPRSTQAPLAPARRGRKALKAGNCSVVFSLSTDRADTTCM
jgi:hypothetical protein